MNDRSDEQLQSQLKEILDAEAERLRHDPELQQRFAEARGAALSKSSKSSSTGFGVVGWGAAVAASVMIMAILSPGGINEAGMAIDPSLLELDSDLVMDVESGTLDTNFYQWVAVEAGSAS